MRPVVRCQAQHLAHGGCQQGQLPFLATKPQTQQALAQTSCWLWDPQVRQGTGPSSGEKVIRPKAEKGDGGEQGRQCISESADGRGWHVGNGECSS